MNANVEKAVTSDINKYLETLLNHLQSERNRLVGKIDKLSGTGEPNPVKFVKNSQFTELLANLLKTPIGSVDVPVAVKREKSSPNSISEAPTKRIKQIQSSTSHHNANPYLLAESVKSETTNNWLPCIPAKPPKPVKIDLNPKVVATFEGKDALGDLLLRPSSIVALPSHSCFAVLHNDDRISFMSHNGHVFKTIRIGVGNDLGSFPTDIVFDAASNNQFIAITTNELRTIGPIGEILNSNLDFVETKVCMENSTKERHFGGAVHASSRTFYTALGAGISCFSTKDWSSRGTFSNKMVGQGYKSGVLGVHENQLYFRGRGDSLFRVPIDTDGRPLMAELTAIPAKFGYLRALEFDQTGNLVAIDRSKCSVDILSREDGRGLGKFQPNYTSFNPGDIAALSAPSNRPFILGENDEASRLYATSDYAMNRVVIFAAPQK